MRENTRDSGGFMRLRDIITASLAAAIVFSSMTAVAMRVVSSSVYRQSRIVSMLVQQDTIGLDGILADRRNIETVIKFAGALTAAYINFELIPVNEAPTFAAVFESLADGIDIDKFEYRRKDLAITGTADGKAEYNAFLAALRSRGYFSSVTGSTYESTQGTTRFEIICASGTVEAYLAF